MIESWEKQLQRDAKMAVRNFVSKSFKVIIEIFKNDFAIVIHSSNLHGPDRA